MRSESELEGVTLLGSTGTNYPSDYSPQIVRNSLPSVQKPDSLILQI